MPFNPERGIIIFLSMIVMNYCFIKVNIAEETVKGRIDFLQSENEVLEKLCEEIDMRPKFQDIHIEADESNFVYNRANYQKLPLDIGSNGEIGRFAGNDAYAVSFHETRILDYQTLKYRPIDNTDIEEVFAQNSNLLFLSLANCDNISDEIIEKIVSLRKLKVLIIDKNCISDTGLKRIRSKLPSCQINPEQKFFSFPFLITRIDGEGGLDLAATRPPVEDEDVQKIAHLPLNRIDLQQSKVTCDAIYALKNMKTLLSLHADSLEVDAESMGYLGRLPNLEEVSFKQTTFCTKSLAELLASKTLKHLSLVQCKFDESEFSALSNQAELSSLNLQQSTITNRLIDYIPRFQKLKEVDLSLTEIDLETIIRLIQKCHSIESLIINNPEFQKKEVESRIKEIRDSIKIMGM